MPRFGTYFRDAPRKDKVTVRQLLSHTSGIYNFWANPRYGEITKAWWKNPDAGGLKARSKEWTYEEMMTLVKRTATSSRARTTSTPTPTTSSCARSRKLSKASPSTGSSSNASPSPWAWTITIYQPAQKPRTDAAHGHWDWPGGHTDHTKASGYVPFMAAASIADAAGAMASTARDLADLGRGAVRR